MRVVCSLLGAWQSLTDDWLPFAQPGIRAIDYTHLRMWQAAIVSEPDILTLSAPPQPERCFARPDRG